MSVTEFLQGLPSYNQDNFSKFQVDANSRATVKKPSVYISTKDYPFEQLIVTERTSILLRYLHQRWDKKLNGVHKKRDHENVDAANDDITQQQKRLRGEHTIS